MKKDECPCKWKACKRRGEREGEQRFPEQVHKVLPLRA